MGSNANRLRQKWQDYSSQNAGKAERNFHETFTVLLEDTEYQIKAKPNDFSKIYVDFPLSEQDLSAIYQPEIAITKHGIFPDYALTNVNTKKTIYVEVKRQDGWVEGKKRSEGRGNAHERSCKFFTPGLQDILREKGNLEAHVLPFWTVFQGDITRDPCRVREIICWYKGVEDHVFFWRDTTNPDLLINHFIDKIKPLLD